MTYRVTYGGLMRRELGTAETLQAARDLILNAGFVPIIMEEEDAAHPDHYDLFAGAGFNCEVFAIEPKEH